MIVLDASVLMLVVEPTARPPIDPATKKPLEKCKERVEFLIEMLSTEKKRVCIPTPVLGEMLVRAGDAKDEVLASLNASSAFFIAPFNEKAAVELSFLLDASGKTKKKLTQQETWAKLKFDRQIIAIAKVNGITKIYSDDLNLATVARANGIDVTHSWQLPLPPVKAQGELDLPVPPNQDEE